LTASRVSSEDGDSALDEWVGQLTTALMVLFLSGQNSLASNRYSRHVSAGKRCESILTVGGSR
jgi:hypothetical protein